MRSGKIKLLTVLVRAYVPQSATEWSRYFFALCAINVWASFIFAIFGSGELQKWAVTDDSRKEDETKDSKTDWVEICPPK